MQSGPESKSTVPLKGFDETLAGQSTSPLEKAGAYTHITNKVPVTSVKNDAND
jgi:hypothetical protein